MTSYQQRKRFWYNGRIMVQIFPFRALRYNAEKLAATGASLDDVVTPPYDVIDAPMQAAFYARHPANFVRIDLNREEDAFGDAACTLARWEADGTLVPEGRPAVYAYSQSWDEAGQTVTRKGVLVLLKLEDLESGRVLPHEHTLKGPKQERLQLMRATRANLSQVFLIYEDPERRMEGLLYENDAPADPWQSATDADGTVHRFRPVQAEGAIRELQALFAEKTLLIADGHHRYETALTLQREAREEIRRRSGSEPPEGSLLTDYAVVFLTNMCDPGLKVYPTHRILERWPAGWDQARFEQALSERFEPVSENETFSYRPAGASPGAMRKLRVKPEAAPAHLPEGLRDFDAAILEEVVFKGILNRTGESMKQDHTLGFYRDEAAVDRLWENNQAVAGFYLAAPSVKLVHDICRSGHRMPQKSTYFYPKILSGLVIYPYRAFADGSHALSGVLEARPWDAPLSQPTA